jgi:hypothetical protein
MSADGRVAALELPPLPKAPASVHIPFDWVRVVGDRAFLSGHGPVDRSGVPVGPFGRVPDVVSLEDAQRSARAAGLSLLGSLREVVGSLDRVAAWCTVTGFVQAEPGYAQTTAVLNPISDCC